jgi:Rabaptin
VDFERRIAGLTDMLRNQITGELRAHFTSELNAHVEQTRREYEERFYAREREWNQLRESMEREIAELRRKVPTNDVMNEIAAAEAVIHASLDSELERMMPNAVSLATLLQSRVEELETQAYLRGLKFSLPEND